jgi:hypothetical protein
MPFREVYRRQVALLVNALPFIAAEDSLALKGGTAINLFVRDMPRLSVDIDLTYVPVAPRPESLAAIDAAMNRIAGRVERGIGGAQVTQMALKGEGAITQLIVRANDAQIKIEVTPVLRGCVYDPETRTVTAAVEEAFGFAETSVVSYADLYAGKFVAALDRQHPRDLFDVHTFLAEDSIDDALRNAFVVYLISHNRPMFEVLAPRPKDIAAEYASGFQGMTSEPISLVELTVALDSLMVCLVTAMPEPHRRFLVSFERGEPDWTLLDLDFVNELPAVLWRQQNLDRLSTTKRRELVENLTRILWP